MTATEFVTTQYIAILEELDQIIKPDLHPAIRSLYVIDPHDLISPEAYFASRDAAVGFVLSLLIAKHKQLQVTA